EGIAVGGFKQDLYSPSAGSPIKLIGRSTMMSPSVAAFLVDVIECAGPRPCAGPDQRSLLAADQSARSGADGCSDTDALGSLFLPRFRVTSLRRARFTVHH